MQTVILVGGGHAHLHCIKQAGKEKLPDTEFILISSFRYQYYSGMFSGYTEGLYGEDDIRVDLGELCRTSRVRFMEDTVIKVDARRKKLLLSSGKEQSYHFASFDIGSSTNTEWSGSSVKTVKPNYAFPEAIRTLRDSPSPVIIGGGAAGAELSMSILARKKRLKQEGNVTLISSSRLIAGESEAASKQLEAIAQRKGIRLVTGETVKDVTDAIVHTASGTIPHSGALILTGPSAFPLFKESGLETTGGGYLLVSDSLQSKSDPSLFGAGDCITLASHPDLPKNGVYAVRQGPVLWNNIKQALVQLPGKPFSPQKRFLSILSTGGKEAMLLYGPFHLHGRLPWKMKNKIDTGFMNQYT